MNKKGFTITELVAVIAIIAILSIAAISGFSTMTNNSKKKSYESKVSTIESAAYKYAKENNISKKTTISVNKLVVMGYLQPDESSDDGLAVLNNPIDNSNMICNTIDINFINNEAIPKYNSSQVDCDLSNEEADAGKIGVVGYCGNDASHTKTPNGETFDWVKCDKFYIRTNPNGLNAADIETIAFDYDGNSIEKKDGTIATNNPTNIDGHKNVIYVDGVADQVINVDVGITYVMKDGKIYYRSVTVRIDKQKPSASVVSRNDTKINESNNVSTREIEVYVDDANGVGAKGFYATKDTNTNGATLNGTDYKAKKYLQLGEWYITPVDKLDNKGEPKKISIENIPGKLGCVMYLYKGDKVTKTARTNNWYNHDLWVNETSPAYENGVSYDITKGTAITNRGQLKQYADKNKAIDYFFNPKQTEDMNITTFYGGLWNVQNKNIVSCSIKAGKDTSLPEVTLSQNSNMTHKQSHSVKVTIKDVSTPAKHNVISGFYTSGTTYKLSYAWAKVGVTPTTWKTVNMHVDDNKTLSVTINDRKDVYGNNMTGGYRLWIKDGSVQDLALNNNKPYTSGEFKLDNTAPTCVSSGGITSWVNYNITLKGTCGDAAGTTDQSGCVGNITKLYSNEINSTTETPGTVYDKAGNSTLCPKNQHTHIDKTKPNCNLSKSPNVTWTNQNTTVYGTCQEKGSIQSGCATNASRVISTAANTISITDSSPGIVKDKAGNQTNCSTIRVQIDKKPPVCTTAKNPNVTWTGGNTTVSGTCGDRTGESGCKSNAAGLTVNIAAGTYEDANKNPGNVIDNAGNVTACNPINVKTDKKIPTVTGISVSSRDTRYNTKNVNVRITGTDPNQSGVATACVQNSNNVNSCTWRAFGGDNTYEDIVASGSHDGSTIYIYGWVKDAVGNVSTMITSGAYVVYKDCTVQVDGAGASCGAYGACSAVCGGGIQYATKSTPRVDAYTSATCPSIVVPNGCSQACNTMDCCSSVTYQQGTACSAACDGGKYIRYAYSAYNGGRCPGKDDYNGAACNTQGCCSKVTYKQGAACSAACDGGKYIRYAYSAYNGGRCPGSDDYKGAACNTQGCCSSTYTHSCTKWKWTKCKNSKKHKKRTCQTSSSYNGQSCGSVTETKSEKKCSTQTKEAWYDCRETTEIHSTQTASFNVNVVGYIDDYDVFWVTKKDGNFFYGCNDDNQCGWVYKFCVNQDQGTFCSPGANGGTCNG